MHFWVCRSLENFESLNNRANMAGRKRKILTLQERVKVVDRLEKGESARMIATSLAVGKTQIQAIATDKVEIKRRWQEGENGKRKYGKQRKCGYPDLDDAVWSWFCEARSRNIPMSGRLIQEKAAVLATAIGHDDFTASNGWLDRWKTRRNALQCIAHFTHIHTHVFRTCYAVLSQTPHERPPRFYDHPNVILRVVVKEGFYCSSNQERHFFCIATSYK